MKSYYSCLPEAGCSYASSLVLTTGREATLAGPDRDVHASTDMARHRGRAVCPSWNGFPSTQRTLNEVLGVAAGVDDLRHDGAFTMADLQEEINTAVGLGYPY